MQQCLHYTAANRLLAVGTVTEVGDGRWFLSVAWADGRAPHTSLHATAPDAEAHGRGLITNGHACGGGCWDWREVKFT